MIPTFTYKDLSEKLKMREKLSNRQRETEKALEKRFAYERMVADISSLAVLVEDLDMFLTTCMRWMWMAISPFATANPLTLSAIFLNVPLRRYGTGISSPGAGAGCAANFRRRPAGFVPDSSARKSKSYRY